MNLFVTEISVRFHAKTFKISWDLDPYTSVMYDQQDSANRGLIARILLTLCIPLFFLVLRSLSRWRQERQLVPSLFQIVIKHLLNDE